jgi:putative transposase
MPNYRRARIEGATYFFTVVTHHRQPLLTHPEILAALREAFRKVKQARPFEIDAIVVLPDHFHALWTMPPDEVDFGTRWSMIKRPISKTVGHFAETTANASMRARRESGLRQRRFWEHLIRDDEDYARHMDYIHFKPVKHGLVSRVADWPHSGFHRCVERGIYPADWASGETSEGNFGE